MYRPFISRAFVAGVCLAAAGQASAGMAINATYEGKFFSVPDWKVTAQKAKIAWEFALANTLVDYTVDITFTSADISGEGGGILARMRNNTQMPMPNVTTGTRLPTAGVVEMNTKDVTFYMDGEVDNNDEEFVMGHTGNVSQLLKGLKQVDGYSVLLHEIGHILGFSGTTGTWNDSAPFTAYTDFANNVGGGNFHFDYLTQGAEGSINGPTTQWATDTFHMTGAAQSGRNMAPTFGFGERRRLSALDVESIVDAFHLKAVPTPGSTAVLGLAGIVALRRRRTAA
ncbi:MAG: hypothetical protein ACKVS8_02700 [Phycisphaerales bacterium]